MFDILAILREIEGNAEKIEKFRKGVLGSQIFENGNIVKVFHGALNGPNGDVGWLYRDFGVRCVNVFDTQ